LSRKFGEAGPGRETRTRRKKERKRGRKGGKRRGKKKREVKREKGRGERLFARDINGYAGGLFNFSRFKFIISLISRPFSPRYTIQR
jgi:hypothetical protein